MNELNWDRHFMLQDFSEESAKSSYRMFLEGKRRIEIKKSLKHFILACENCNILQKAWRCKLFLCIAKLNNTQKDSKGSPVQHIMNKIDLNCNDLLFTLSLRQIRLVLVHISSVILLICFSKNAARVRCGIL